MNRRDFLRTTAAVGAAAALGGTTGADAARLPGGSLLDLPAAQSPIDTIVVMMMENRSFDHYLGWLASDETFLEDGRSRWGRRFGVNGSTSEIYTAPDGTLVPTSPLLEGTDANPWRGCGHPDPGHGWNAGRAQRDGGFLATGSGNDPFALGWYRAEDLPFYAALSRRFTTFDRMHCSVLGPTYPNREYMHSAQSGGIKKNDFPWELGFADGFDWPTIWDRLASRSIPARYYYVDLPVVALWGSRLLPLASPLARFFEDAAAGTLPNVVFVDPGFLGDTRSDEHPHGDPRAGEALVMRVVKAFVESPQWHRGALFLTYDEWGGFFDHVRPPRLPDDRASGVDADDFRQAGFRVPARVLSPCARRNFVDHRLYDHTSILRFIEWRFLGAPPEGTGRAYTQWWLTLRDRRAKNIGWSLMPDSPDPDFDVSAFVEPVPSAACGAPDTGRAVQTAVRDHDFARGADWIASRGCQIGDWLPG